MRFDNKLLYLFGFSLILRILINSQDPFLHSWDERFHALVAKNMMTHPFTPMLRTDPVLPYDETSWTEGHFWVHKQPLFLWQMALSMKLFGVNLFALRLPSALMGALSVLLISRIGILFNNKFAGLVAALLFTFSSYQLELTNGVVGMDHNDVAFGFYILASFWCYFEYRESNKKYWVLLIGLFAGCAILNKWLVGLLIFAIWGIEILLQYKMHMRLKHFIPMLQALVICCIVFIPWQIYILNRFPKQAAFTYQFNERHITEALEGHTGSVFYFLQIFPWQYSFLIIPFLIIALIGWLKNKFSTKMFLPLAFAIFIIYFFFSVIVKTKSSNYVFIVAPFIFLISGFGFDLFRHWVINLFDKKKAVIITYLSLIILIISLFRPYTLYKYHFKKGGYYFNDEDRTAKKYNTSVYKQLDSILPEKYVILNCKSFEDIEAMFWSKHNVYQWFPNERDYLQLKENGYKIAAFPNMLGQDLPDYIVNDFDVVMIDKRLK